MTLEAPEQTFVHDATQLHELWRDMMGGGGFAERTLWMIFLQSSGRLSPVVSPIDDVPAEPDDLLLGNLAKVVTQLVTEFGGTAAFLLSGPGPKDLCAGDRRWARTMRTAIPRGFSPWPMHLATYEHVRVFAPDDLTGSA